MSSITIKAYSRAQQTRGLNISRILGSESPKGQPWSTVLKRLVTTFLVEHLIRPDAHHVAESILAPENEFADIRFLLLWVVDVVIVWHFLNAAKKLTYEN
jgi:hypothetical protein